MRKGRHLTKNAPITFNDGEYVLYTLSIDKHNQPQLYNIKLDSLQKIEYADELIDFTEMGDFENFYIKDAIYKNNRTLSKEINRSLKEILRFIVKDYIDKHSKNITNKDDEFEYEVFDEIYGYIGYNPVIAEIFKRFNIEGTSDLIEWFNKHE